PVVLLDEPTTSLDSEARREVVHLIDRVFDSRLCIIVSHDEYLRQELSDLSVLQLTEGELGGR
ncbi:MAG: ABC transporter ATP-binding protein, partial [Micrococcales bacterium]|nr:ABC transporter ATP-binding protein [Micrococcales bacterium]